MDGADNKYWFDGQPFGFLTSSDAPTGGGDAKFWFDGQPYELLQTAPVTETFDGFFLMFYP